MTHEDTELRFFDAEWYLEQNPDVATLNIDPLTHFTEMGWKEGRNPSKHFDVKQYIETHPETLVLNMHPFWHINFCFHNDSIVSLDFPKQCQTVVHNFGVNEGQKFYNRVVVFAAFLPEGVIEPYLLYYLRGLKKVSDCIIFIADSPVLPEEVKKLAPFVKYAICERHGKYDFGSYQRGIQYVKEHIGLENIEELILCNDSCIAPVVPFEEMFQTMASSPVDFWGLTLNVEVMLHLQSFFLAFRKNVLQSEAFLNIFTHIPRGEVRSSVILKYEIPLMRMLCDAGFQCGAYIAYPSIDEFVTKALQKLNLTMSPCFLLEKRSPLIKLQSLYDKKVNYDGFVKTQTFLAKINPDLARLVEGYLDKKRRQPHALRSRQKRVHEADYARFKCLQRELQQYDEKYPRILREVPESQIMHTYLDGLCGIEIGASSHNRFGLDKTSPFYANIDYKADHGDLWQKGSVLPPAKVHVVAQGDVLPFQNECLDYVISSHVIEHFFDPIATIKEWFRLVKKGGYVALIVPHKARTFDNLRKVTSLKELYDRHEGRLTSADYAYATFKPTPTQSLPKNYLIRVKDDAIPDGYVPLASDVDAAHCHLTVWTTESFRALCHAMQWNIVKLRDRDDKIGNGFLCILQK